MNKKDSVDHVEKQVHMLEDEICNKQNSRLTKTKRNIQSMKNGKQ